MAQCDRKDRPQRSRAHGAGCCSSTAGLWQAAINITTAKLWVMGRMLGLMHGYSGNPDQWRWSKPPSACWPPGWAADALTSEPTGSANEDGNSVPTCHRGRGMHERGTQTAGCYTNVEPGTVQREVPTGWNNTTDATGWVREYRTGDICVSSGGTNRAECLKLAARHDQTRSRGP